MSKKYEVIIIGGGISGAALCYELSRYTNIKKIAVIEKYGEIGSLNTKGTSNSQTIHFGDIETNYTLAKAKITKRTATMVERYCLQHNYKNSIIFSHQKMALGVGDEEVEFMLERYEEFSSLFPKLNIWDKEKLKEIEPNIVFDKDGKERQDNIVGIGSIGEWTTVDYGKMAVSLIENSKKENNEIDIFLNSEVVEIIKEESGFCVIVKNGEKYYSDFVVVNAVAHSLFFAHSMGYGLDFGCLPVAGSFYKSNKKILKGKVYMVQNPKLPFAALHGDPDILLDGNTRFGPTALILPKLERYKPGTYLDFWKTLRFDSNILAIFKNLLKEDDIRSYIFRNILFEVPLINKKLFIEDAKKIVPSLGVEDIEYANGFGGVRPQVLNKKDRKLILGEASINPQNGIIFNMTPSPGATSCLGNGERDLRSIVKFLDKEFYEEKFNEELLEKESCVLEEPIKEQKEYASKIRALIYELEKKHKLDSEYLPSYWNSPYSPWVNKKDSWSF